MAENHKYIKPYTAADIQRYLNRQMSVQERHAMEKAALDDPFLAEAIEGYTQHSSPALSSDIENLRKRLQEKDDVKAIPAGNRRIWWSAAAAILIVLGTGITWYWLAPTENNIAQQKEKEQKIAPLKEEQESAGVPAATDSTAIALQENKTLEKNTAPASEPEKKVVVPPPVPSSKTKQPPAPGAAAKKDVPENLSPDIAAANREATTEAYRIEQQESQRDKSLSAQSRERPLPATTQNNASVFLNTIIFTGKITDSNNNPLPFVNIRINNTTSTAYSDARGNFRLLSGDSILNVQVRSAGFEPQQVVLQASTPSHNIILLPGKNTLPEVAVTGYGTAKKKAVTTDEDTDATPEAEPTDGWGNYDIYLVNNTRLPRTAATASRGFVDLEFNVDQYGRLSNFKIIHSTCPPCNKEAIRVIKEGPQWKLSEGDIPAKVSLTLQF